MKENCLAGARLFSEVVMKSKEVVRHNDDDTTTLHLSICYYYSRILLFHTVFHTEISMHAKMGNSKILFDTPFIV